jgi:hypothetical protein
MGAPLMLSKNGSRSLENNLSEEHLDMPENEPETAINGKLDINIKDNSLRDKSDNNVQYYQTQQSNDNLRHNYH